jgi:hypothetical protein
VTKYKMWAVCYKNIDRTPQWEPYSGAVHHYRSDAISQQISEYPHGFIKPLDVRTISPKRRQASK